MSRRLDPKPAPAPAPACGGAPCGRVFKESQPLEEVTCPCGYGYWDKLRRTFVDGSLVRAGKAPSREEYEAHVRRCPEQEQGAPVLAVLGANSKNAGAVVYLGASGEGLLPPRSVNPYSVNPTLQGRHGYSVVDARNHDGPRPMASIPREQKTISRTQINSIFLPEDHVDKDVLQFYLQWLHTRTGTIIDQRSTVGCNCHILYPRTYALLPDPRSKVRMDTYRTRASLCKFLTSTDDRCKESHSGS